MKLSKNKQLKSFLVENILLTSFSAIAILSLIMVIVAICVLPFPERYFIGQLDYIMITMGQKISLYLIYIFAITGAVSIILSWYIKKDPINRTPINYSNAWIYVYNVLFSFFINFLAPLTFWVHWIDLRYIEKMCFQNKKLNENTIFYQRCNDFLVSSESDEAYRLQQIWKRSAAKIKYIKFFIIVFFPIIILSSIGTIFGCVFFAAKNNNLINDDNSGLYKNKYYNISDSKNFMTISNNNVNTIMYYFDRGQGILFNSLIYFDYLKYGNESLMVRFPEFTSYLQSVSTTSTTNGTNPSIISSIFYSPITKNLSEINPFTNVSYKDETIKDTWMSSIANQANMFYETGTDNYKISQIPYVSTDYTGSDYGNTKWINETLSKTHSNFVSTTNESIAYTMNDFKGMNRTSDAVAWKNGPNNYAFENTNSPVYQGWYMHFTHEFYAYYDYDNETWFSNVSNRPIDFLKATWFAVQELKNNLQRLKDEPFYDQDGNEIGTVYDHSQIVIASDHGYALYGNNSEIRKLIKYVSQNSNINYDQNKVDQFIDYYVRKDHSDEILKNNALFAFDNVLIYKPIKGTYPYIDQHKLFTFNTDSLVTSGDVQLFLEAGLKRYNALKKGEQMDNFEISDSFFAKKIDGDNPQLNWINDYIVYDPLINSEKLKNRKIVLLNFRNWRFDPNSKISEIFSYWSTDTSLLDLSEKNFILAFNNFELTY